ncbi:TPA: hypothetical protein ACH3X3_013625 [Trebouxia sp. C0006]
MLGSASVKPCSGVSARAFRGDVTSLRLGRVQHARSTAVRLVQAKKRKSDAEESAEGPQGFTGRVKAGISQTISSRMPGRKQGSSQGDDATPAKKQGGFRIGTISIGGSGIRRTDPNTVFVAGATGRLGCRVVLELLRNKKLKVRAGARNPEEARNLVKTATDYGILTGDAARRLTVVPVDLEDEDSIAPAVGNAGRVVQAIGAAETKLFDFGAPKRIDGEAAIKLVNVAKDLGVTQYIMVTSLGTGKVGFPASLLNLFWGVLVFKKKAEKALEASGIPYVIVRPGGMERPTDSYKRTHNVRLATRDKLFGGQVSRLQVAELIAASVTYPDAAQNKVLEVVAEETAEELSYMELLEAHPAEGEEPTQTQTSSQSKLGAAKQQANQKAEKAKEAASQAAPQEVKSKASRAVSKGKQSLAEAAPGSPDSDGIEEDFKEAVNTAKKSFFESAEELDKERLEAREKVNAEGKQQRQENARRNAEAVAKQKVETEAQNKKKAEEDKKKQEQQAKKDAEAKAAAEKKKKSEPKPAPKAEPEKKTEAQAAPNAAPKEAPKAEPKKKTEGKAESSAATSPEAKEQAQRAAEGAKEAREWISNWREGKTKGMTVRSTVNCT